MNSLTHRDPAFYAEPVHGGPVAALAGLTTSPTSDTGIAVDKHAVSDGKQFQGVLLQVPVEVVLDTGQSLTVDMTLQHSDASSSGWATLATGSETLSNTSASTGVTIRGVPNLSVNALSAKRWLRAKSVMTGSAADTGGDLTASTYLLTFTGPNEGAP